jgi:hypothetical protein
LRLSDKTARKHFFQYKTGAKVTPPAEKEPDRDSANDSDFLGDDDNADDDDDDDGYYQDVDHDAESDNTVQLPDEYVWILMTTTSQRTPFGLVKSVLNCEVSRQWRLL